MFNYNGLKTSTVIHGHNYPLGRVTVILPITQTSSLTDSAQTDFTKKQ